MNMRGACARCHISARCRLGCKGRCPRSSLSPAHGARGRRGPDRCARGHAVPASDAQHVPRRDLHAVGGRRTPPKVVSKETTRSLKRTSSRGTCPNARSAGGTVKFRFALLAAAATRAAVEVDLLDEVPYWGSDDYWRHSRLAAIAWIRAVVDKRSIPMSALCNRLRVRAESRLADFRGDRLTITFRNVCSPQSRRSGTTGRLDDEVSLTVV
jgi:hypothetical protein